MEDNVCFLGKRCMGGFEFELAMDVPYRNDISIEIDSLVEVAREVAREALAEKVKVLKFVI